MDPQPIPNPIDTLTKKLKLKRKLGLSTQINSD